MQKKISGTFKSTTISRTFECTTNSRTVEVQAHNLHKYTKSSDVSIMSNGTMDLNQQEKWPNQVIPTKVKTTN